MKNRKCHFCKIEDQETNLIRVEVGDKTKLKKYAHQECYKKYLDRKEFFSYLHEALDIPKLDRWTVMNINSIGQNYSYEVMLHALKVKQNVMLEKFEKGFPYILAILKNQLLFSYKEIKKQQKEKELQQHNINNNSFPYEELPETKYKQKEGRLDISNLLD
jgi:hypothetical protein